MASIDFVICTTPETPNWGNNSGRGLLPEEAYVHPVEDGREAFAEIERSYRLGGMSAAAYARALHRLDRAPTDEAMVDVVTSEHLKSPIAPNTECHRQGCDFPCCQPAGEMALRGAGISGIS